MGNAYSEIANYLSGSDGSDGSELSDTNSDLASQLKSLQTQIDQDRNNIVTKDELNDFFVQLANKIDKNSDGIISKDELETYVDTQLKASRDEVEVWKKSYETLHDKYDQLLDSYNNNSYNNNNSYSDQQKPNLTSNISQQALKDYIKNEIINTDANLSLVPDVLEKKIYLAVYRTVMKTLESLFNTTTIDLMNHQIKFAIQPIPQEER